MPGKAVLSLEMLSIGYSGKPALVENLSLAVQGGDFVCLLGRNGVGKSTLLRTLASLQPAISGTTVLNGEILSELGAIQRARRVAVVLTERVSAPGLFVEDVLLLARQPYTSWIGGEGEEDLKIGLHALADVGGTHLTGRTIDSLSDGERQRVMIARALAQMPRLLLLDEITAFLDLPGRVEIMAMLREAARSRDLIVILSSHDLDLSLQLADKIWLMTGGAVHPGSPNDLAKSGIINSAFDTQTVAFSPEHGRFQLRDAVLAKP